MILVKSRLCEEIIKQNITNDDESMFLEEIYLDFLKEELKNMKNEELVKTVIELDKYKNLLEKIIEMFYFEKMQKRLSRRKN